IGVTAGTADATGAAHDPQPAVYALAECATAAAAAHNATGPSARDLDLTFGRPASKWTFGAAEAKWRADSSGAKWTLGPPSL
ncbi:MAG TPA: hypothetical protein VGD39_10690, partial [Nocardioides sp.]